MTEAEARARLELLLLEDRQPTSAELSEIAAVLGRETLEEYGFTWIEDMPDAAEDARFGVPAQVPVPGFGILSAVADRIIGRDGERPAPAPAAPSGEDAAAGAAAAAAGGGATGATGGTLGDLSAYSSYQGAPLSRSAMLFLGHMLMKPPPGASGTEMQAWRDDHQRLTELIGDEVAWEAGFARDADGGLTPKLMLGPEESAAYKENLDRRIADALTASGASALGSDIDHWQLALRLDEQQFDQRVTQGRERREDARLALARTADSRNALSEAIEQAQGLYADLPHNFEDFGVLRAAAESIFDSFAPQPARPATVSAPGLAADDPRRVGIPDIEPLSPDPFRRFEPPARERDVVPLPGGRR